MSDFNKLEYYDKENKFPKLTKNNAEFLTCICTEVDSVYRRSFSVDSKGSSAYLINQNKADDNWIKDPNKVLDVCKAIDKENATHLSVSGYSKDNEHKNLNNLGLEQMVVFLSNYKQIKGGRSLLDEIREGEPGIVDEIASAVIDIPNYGHPEELLVSIQNRFERDGKDIRITNPDFEIIRQHLSEPEKPTISKYSFASKFCTYVSRSYGNDDYAIYDNVVRSILPFYLFKECGFQEAVGHIRCQSNGQIKSIINDNYDYHSYRDLICKLKNKTGLLLKEIDMILWYYYKGDEKLIDEAMNCVRNN